MKPSSHQVNRQRQGIGSVQADPMAIAQYIYDTYGKFPGTVQSIFCFMYIQAQHLDLDFYDPYFKPGSYLTTHKEHMKKWH
jgi:hypothetical protein